MKTIHPANRDKIYQECGSDYFDAIPPNYATLPATKLPEYEDITYDYEADDWETAGPLGTKKERR